MSAPNVVITAQGADILVNGELLKEGQSATLEYLSSPMSVVQITRTDHPNLDEFGLPKWA